MAENMAVSQGPQNIAQPWFDGGCSVIPIRANGSKRPAIEWKQYQEQRLAQNEVDTYWRSGSTYGVAVICGAISGDLEMTEIEGDWTDTESLTTITDYAELYGVREQWENLLHRGYAEWSPSGGIHVLYRLKDGTVPGNTKLASTPDGKTKAETRGEGGYVIVAPTGGKCHPSGEGWETVAGTPGLIPYLTMEERDAIHRAITAALDETPAPLPVPVRRTQVLLPTGDRPGDIYNARTSWPEILEPHGWQVSEQRGQETLWVRPGKAIRDGHSASTGYSGSGDRMFVWSTSAGLPTEQPMSKFFVYAALNHGGDLREATRTLSKQGFGSKAEVSSTADWATEPSREVARKETPVPATSNTVNEIASQGEVPLPSVRPATLSDSGNADFMLELLREKFRYIPQRKKWLTFEDGIWVIDYEGVLLQEAIGQEYKRLYFEAEAAGDEKLLKHYLNCLSAAKIKATAHIMRGRPQVFARPDQFDARPATMNLENGTLDLQTMEIHDHDPDDLLTKKMGCGYNPNAKSPVFDAFLERAMPNPEMRHFFLKLMGYALTGRPNERSLGILHGPAGTGKSKLIETMTSMFGTYGTTASDSLFRSKRDAPAGVSNDLNDLKGARLASVSELDAGIRMDEALVKRLTGMDTITSRGLYEENTSWRPQCLILLGTNNLPRITSDDAAIFERLKLITMDQQIPFEERDPDLLDKLMAERDGIFNRLLEGLAAYRKEGLKSPEASIKALESYKAEQDPVGQFLEELVYEGHFELGEGRDFLISKTTLLQRYQAWSKDQGQFPLPKTRFNIRMETLGYEEHKRGILYWKGIRLNPSYSITGVMA